MFQFKQIVKPHAGYLPYSMPLDMNSAAFQRGRLRLHTQQNSHLGETVICKELSLEQI